MSSGGSQRHQPHTRHSSSLRLQKRDGFLCGQGAFSVGRHARTDRRQIEHTAAFEPPGRGDSGCGIRVGTQIPAIEDDKPAFESEVFACQAAQWQASLVQRLDQECAFEVVGGEFPAATVAVGLEKTRRLSIVAVPAE